ncbi:HPr family phosphocarrier protein [Chelatococcus asaccharovorans]|uniref:Phosphoenolpyruvate-protein phosphotransferase n=1 Tax=Chelatococcus asaccharovorans TaxID=28210 RepID=A0A2V3TVN3_9HYPH|nr:HPr family phosphocarrier protein [Chelatococcus asaccharovorans]MBS7706165.1 HPr family phosphocarrier protein [Chelatococcus asaccharovorans]PXW52540.1 phosphoenolpyruvate--protein phosphotransferase [Chelatococcus asaccharovorans]
MTCYRRGSVLLTNAIGLHARPSVRLVQMARQFDADIEIATDPKGPWIDARSIVKLMRVRARRGTTLHIRTAGPDAARALALVHSFAAGGFDGQPAEPAAGELIIIGKSASPGRAHGPVHVLRSAQSSSRARNGDGLQVLRTAIESATAQLTELMARSHDDGLQILSFQREFLRDETLMGGAAASIAAGKDAADAWTEVVQAEIDGYEQSDDEDFFARAADLRDLSIRVTALLNGTMSPDPVPPGSIVFADEVLPSQFLSVDWRQGGALVTRRGSPRSHVALLARSRGVPMIVQAAGLPDRPGETALVDGNNGIVVINPERNHALPAQAKATAGAGRMPARPTVWENSTGGQDEFRLLINVSGADELSGIDPVICDGIGLVRTEFMFMGTALPSEEEQLNAYSLILRWARGLPVTIRTLDAGGDKPVAGLSLGGESNPFLGLRGVRLALANRDVFRVQLRALLRAAAVGPLRVMIPMVTMPSELEAVRELLQQEYAALSSEGVACAPVSLGMMVEVPAAALTIKRFNADFYSIGSNDLVQYVTAAARDNGAVGDVYDPLNEAVLQIISSVVEFGRQSGRPVSLCGDAGADPAVLPALIATGLQSFSVPVDAVAAVRAVIRSVAASRQTQVPPQAHPTDSRS